MWFDSLSSYLTPNSTTMMECVCFILRVRIILAHSTNSQSIDCCSHGDLKFRWVKEGWRIAPIFMYDRAFFVGLGGLDCSYEHVNMNTHDLAFQVQQKGGRIFTSPKSIWFDWQPEKKDYMPILSSFIVNDRPKFNQQYSHGRCGFENSFSSITGVRRKPFGRRFKTWNYI